jgi:thiol-disulfide isomerase/thioredoxin
MVIGWSVMQLNETALEKALDLVHSSNGTYVAVLYYANWCPFSREVRPVYDVLSSVFPTIHHVAVEESSVRPRSALDPFNPTLLGRDDMMKKPQQ